MSTSGAASTVAGYLKTKYIKDMSESLEESLDKHALPATEVKNLVTIASNALLPSLKPVMTDIIDRIKLTNHDLRMQELRPHSMYLGHEEWHQLKDSNEFVTTSAYSDDTNKTPHKFMGYSLYIVHQSSHFVLTGE